MRTDRIVPHGDVRIEHKSTLLNGRTYHYLLGRPKGPRKGTVFLFHGWPDCSMGWRFQIPVLLDLGLQVVCPDLMGYGQTDAPRVPPESIALYSFKRAADDCAELARQLDVAKIMIGGHDWGGAIVYRFALWYPDLVTHVFSVCTPYFAPSKNYVSVEQFAKALPQFGYQLNLAGPKVEASITTKAQIRSFLNALYGGRTSDGTVAFTAEQGLDINILPRTGKSPLLSDEELDYYVDQFSRNGMHGTLNWYRTRKINYEEELPIVGRTISAPVLFIQANRDVVLTPSLSVGMENALPNLTRREVNTTHWALWEDPKTVNKHLTDWITSVVFGGRSKI